MGRKLRNFGVAVLSIAAFMTLINVVPPAKSVSDNPFIKGENEKVMIAAHRGGADNNPENTLLAYRAAVNEYKVDILESDLYLTKDGYLVYNHDSYIDETCILFEEIAVSAGQRGVQVILDPQDLIRYVGAAEADVTKEME